MLLELTFRTFCFQQRFHHRITNLCFNQMPQRIWRGLPMTDSHGTSLVHLPTYFDPLKVNHSWIGKSHGSVMGVCFLVSGFGPEPSKQWLRKASMCIRGPNKTFTCHDYILGGGLASKVISGVMILYNCQELAYIFWVVVSNIFDFYSIWGRWL